MHLNTRCLKSDNDSSHPDVEVSILVTGPDAKGVVSPRRDAGGLNLKDVGGGRALWGDGHIAVDDGERQVSTGWLADRTHTAAGHTRWRKKSNSEWFCISLWSFVCLCGRFASLCSHFAYFCGHSGPICGHFAPLSSDFEMLTVTSNGGSDPGGP